MISKFRKFILCGKKWVEPKTPLKGVSQTPEGKKLFTKVRPACDDRYSDHDKPQHKVKFLVKDVDGQDAERIIFLDDHSYVWPPHFPGYF